MAGPGQMVSRLPETEQTLQIASSSTELGELSCEKGRISGWKTVVVQDGKFHAAVIGKVFGDSACAISPASFHKYVRKGPFARWLDHSGARSTRGDLKMNKMAKLLNVSPLCTLVPSERMVMPTSFKRKRTQQHGVHGSSHGFEALASPVWLIVYTLLANCCNLRKKAAAAVALRKRAFQILDMLVHLSCQASGATTLRTRHVTFSVSEDGHLQGDDQWKQLATDLGAADAAYCKDRLAQVYTGMKAGQDQDHARVGEGVVGVGSLSGMLWLVARLCSKLGGEALDVARDLACDLVMFVADSVTQWFVSLPASGARTVDLIAAQPQRSRTMPALVARMLEKKRPRAVAQEWRSDGIGTVPNATHLERRASTAYLCNVHRSLGSANIIGLGLDSTTFATKETNVTMAYAPSINLGAYLPPIRCRKIRWRAAPAGQEVSEADKAQFLKTGYRTVPRMEIWDFVCELEHVLKSGLGKSLHDFRFHEEFPVMDAQHVRYYHPTKKQWYRVPASGLTAEGMPELSPKTLGLLPSDIGVLLLDEDQKQSQWSGSHFLVDPASGLNLMVWFRGDKYHRSWRDWQWATSKAPGHFNWTSVQLNYLFNINYQPIGSGGHFSKRQEMKLDWERLFPKAGPEFEALIQNIGLDSRRPPPTGLRGVEAFYKEFVLDDTLSTRKGKFMKQCAWYDIIRAIDNYDTRWHARRFEVEEVARYLRGEGMESKAFVAKVAQAILTQEKDLEALKKESSKESYQAKMKHLRKAAGNCLLLAPRLVHNGNLVNSRVMLLVSRIMWTEQTYWGMLKVCSGLVPEFSPRNC